MILLCDLERSTDGVDEDLDAAYLDWLASILNQNQIHLFDVFAAGWEAGSDHVAEFVADGGSIIGEPKRKG